MISLAQLRTIPKIQPGMEKQEKQQEYLYTIERAIIDSWRNHESSVTVERKDDIMDAKELREYLTYKGFKVSLARKDPAKIKIFFTEAEF